MSYYYNYYIGYKKDGKFYPWGPFNAAGTLKPALSRSGSFASDLHESFRLIKKEEVSEELRKYFEYKGWDEKKVLEKIKYYRVDDLPKESFIKTGYFLTKEVRAYEESQKNEGWFDGFSDVLSPQVYVAKMFHEMAYGKNQPQKDVEGFEYTEPNASDYMYYMYPDYSCKEYEAFILREWVDALEDWTCQDDKEYVILETEG